MRESLRIRAMGAADWIKPTPDEFIMSIHPAGAVQGLSVEATVGGSSFSMERIEGGKSR